MRRLAVVAALMLVGCGTPGNGPELDLGVRRSGDFVIAHCRERYCNVQLLYAGPGRTEVHVAADTEDRGHAEAHLEGTVARHIQVELGSGTNNLWTFQLGFSDVEDLTVTTGDGDNDLYLASTTVAQRLTITTGAGADHVTLSIAGGRVGTEVDTGAGPDVVDLPYGFGPARIATGDDGDVITFEGSDVAAEPIAIDAGPGDDAVLLGPFCCQGPLRLDGGPGTDDLDLAGATLGDTAAAAEFETVRHPAEAR